MAIFESSNSTGYVIQGAVAGDQLGSSVSGAGDVNKDGFADIIVGARFAGPHSRTEAGAAYLIFGKGGGFSTLSLDGFSSGSAGFIIQGGAAGDYLGSAVSAAGDVNNDTYADILVGAYGADPNSREGAGAAYLILGRAAGFATLDMAIFESSNSTGYVIQ
ncbi:hypothetical protein B484DRAFT_410852, partial [Ochromonadaceae sp. CCMP2298]